MTDAAKLDCSAIAMPLLQTRDRDSIMVTDVADRCVRADPGLSPRSAA
jgi:hypothetical protein